MLRVANLACGENRPKKEANGKNEVTEKSIARKGQLKKVINENNKIQPHTTYYA